MTTPLSDERIAEMREFWDGHEDGDTSDDRAVWRFVHHASLDLLEEVERLRGIVQWREALADVADDLRAELGKSHEGLTNCDAEVARLRARVAALEGVLRSVEWGGGLVNRIDDMDGTYLGLVPTCPKCLELKSDGHAPDCELAAVLRDASE